LVSHMTLSGKPLPQALIFVLHFLHTS
jgi:hypothetical protein